MSTAPTQIKINKTSKQCVMKKEIPFEVTTSSYKKEVLEAIQEAKNLSKDPNTKRYLSFSEALKDLKM